MSMMTEEQGFESGQEYFSLLHNAQSGPGAHPTSYTMGTGGSFPGVKPEGCVTHHSPPSSPQLRIMELYLHFHIRFHGVFPN
jgi:hypothetical protein